jgi:hypothetical protein
LPNQQNGQRKREPAELGNWQGGVHSSAEFASEHAIRKP